MFTSLIARVGTWYRVFNLAAGLARRGHEVSIVKGGLQRFLPRSKLEAGVTIWDFPRFFGSSVFHRGTRMPWDIVDRTLFGIAQRADVIHSFTHHLNSLLPTLLAGRLAQTPVVVGDRDDLWADGGLYGDGDADSWVARMDHQFHAWTERAMGRWLDALTVASDDLMQRAYSTGAAPGSIRKIINGCPVDRIRPGDRLAARAALGIENERRVLLFIGVGQYDIDLILDSLVLLKRSGWAAEAFPLLYLVGPNENLLRRLVGERALEANVVTTGFLSDEGILPYLHAADIGLLPFADKALNRARFPIKIGDYLAAGLPILTNRVGEMGRIVEGEAAGLATGANAESFAEGLRQMIADPASLGRQRVNARAAAERMSWDRVSGDLEQFYSERLPPRAPLGQHAHKGEQNRCGS